MAVPYVGPYSPEAYNAANIIKGGGAGTPYSSSIIDAGHAILGGGGGGGGHTGGGGGGGGRSAAPAPVDPYAAQYNAANSQIDSQLGRLGTQQGIGQGNILRGYNAALDTLLNGKNLATRDYNTSRTNTIQDNVTAKNDIANNVRSQNQGAQRLLGIRGAGSGSAAQVTAPYAAARQGNTQQAGVNETYSRNLGSLDTNYGDYNKQYDSQVGVLGADKDNRLNQLLGGIASTRQGLLNQKQQLAASAGRPVDPGLTNQINALGGQIDQYGVQQTFDPGHVDYKAPDLAAYNTQLSTAPSAASNNPLQQATGSFFNLLNPQKDKNKVGAIV